MAESIVLVRLIRNLRYKLTYIKIFESYMEPNPGPAMIELLTSLVQAQQLAVAPLSSYLRRLDVSSQDLEPDDKLLTHAASRDNIKSQLRFIFEGLTRSVSWYKMQVVDKQMTADPELRKLLFQLGEIDAAQLWRTEATMAMLGVPTMVKPKEWSEQRRQEPDATEGWRPRLVEDVRSFDWNGEPYSTRYRPGGPQTRE